MIAVTLDTDWTPTEALDYTFAHIIDDQLPLTVFCTDRYPPAERRARTEIAFHYNVEEVGFEAAYRAIAARLPAARGARGHSLAVSERLRPLYQEFGTCYDSSFLMFQQQHIVPFRIAPAVWEFPIYFMDTFFMEYFQGDFGASPTRKQLDQPGLKVFDFHPVHLLLNTPSLAYYQENKKYYHDLAALLRHRYQGWGVCSLFQQIQKWVLEKICSTTTLLDLARQLDAAAKSHAIAG